MSDDQQATPAPQPDAQQSTPQPPEAMVRRMSEMTRARDEARQQVETLTARVQQLEQSLQQTSTRAETVATDLALAESGLVQSEARIVARALHSALPEDGRPSLAEWVTGLRDAPDTAPAALRAYIAPAASSAPPAAKPSPSSGQPQAATSTGGGVDLPASRPAVQSPPPAASPMDALDGAREAMQAAMRSGDREALRQARADLERHLGALAPRRGLR